MKAKTIFVCNECGYESAKWMGKCPAFAIHGIHFLRKKFLQK